MQSSQDKLYSENIIVCAKLICFKCHDVCAYCVSLYGNKFSEIGTELVADTLKINFSLLDL